MNFPKCGKALPDNAAKCKKCGEVFKENKGSAEMDAFLKKEKEKAAARNNKIKKNKGKKPVNKGLIIGVVSAVVVIAVLLGVLYSFNIIGSRNNHRVEEKSALDIEYTFELDEDDEIVMSFGDIKISDAEYEFYFRQSYSTLQNSVQLSFKDFMSKKLGEEYNDASDYTTDYFHEYAAENPETFDITRPIDRQLNGVFDEKSGKEISWTEYIRNDAIESMLAYRVKYELAVKMGLELTDDVKYQVFEHIEGLRTAVLQGGYPSLDEYLKILFGDACDEEFFKNELIREYMATKYETELNNRLMSGYTDEEIKSIYAADYKDYDYADIYLYEAKGDNAKAVADKIASESSNLDDFTKSITANAHYGSDKESYPTVPKYYIDNNYTEEVGNWAFDRARKTGDTGVFKTKDGYCVVFIQTPSYSKGECVTYREIVLNKVSGDGKALNGEELKAVEEKINDIYDQWEDGDADENTFAYFALQNSKGSTAASGGLNSGIVKNEMADGEVKTWLFDEKRKAGDTELIETDTAYTIVYYVNGYNNYWNYSIRNKKAGESVQSEFETAKNKTYTVSYNTESLYDVESSYISSLARIYLGIDSK